MESGWYPTWSYRVQTTEVPLKMPREDGPPFGRSGRSAGSDYSREVGIASVISISGHMAPRPQNPSAEAFSSSLDYSIDEG